MMSEKKQKRIGTDGTGFLAAILLWGLVFCWFSPCWAMDVMTAGELETMSGQVGITLAFGGRFTPMKATFQTLSFGDPDGWGTGLSQLGSDNANNRGWLVLVGTGANTGTLSFVVPDGVKMDFNAGTTGASACTITGFSIPANTPFFHFTMTDAEIGLYDPTTVNVCLTYNPTGDVGVYPVPVGGDGPGTTLDMEVVGWMQTEGLTIDKDGTKLSECYIWARP